MQTVCFGLLVVFFCNGAKTVQAFDSYCQIARPIIASSHDTAQTLASIRAENAKIRKLCPKAK